MVSALCKEIEMRNGFLNAPLETIYFGGGTPSVLQPYELEQLFATIHKQFSILPNAEINFECNPDDITKEYCQKLRSLGVNRLSIGIQSFFDDDLQLLNRRHSANSAKKAVEIAQNCGFSNITVDLIYGLPNMTLERWKQNLNEVAKLHVQHLSAYSLMVEEHTALHKFVRTGKFILPTEESVLEQFNYLIDWSQQTGFEQYEISNFAKKDFQSRHNSAYWCGKPYLGIGPSAHSFNGDNRYWNIAHNAKYISALQNSVLPLEEEHLSVKDKYNELIMTGLRTRNGVDIDWVKNNFPNEYYHTFAQTKNKYLAQNLVQEKENKIILTRNGIMLSDMIMSDFFITD